MVSIDAIRHIAIVGAGTMGSGIAQACALAGYTTTLFDVQPEALERGMATVRKNIQGAVDRQKLTSEDMEAALGRIAPTGRFEDLVADVAIEAVIEKAELKLDILQRLAAQNAPRCILATNTSSIPITRLAAGTPGPERIVGLHFFNPVHLMKLVEVISGAATHPEVAKAMHELAKRLGKVPVMAKDAPGFIVNRVARPYYTEALKLLEEGVATVESIDRLMEASGFRMGPFRLMDLIGVDSNFYTTQAMYHSFHEEPRFRPSRIQEQLVQAGKHGRKSGEGFYQYGKS